MNCLICVKPFVKEKDFENYTWNPELCKSSISKLFGISNDPDVQGVFEDLEVCRSCHECLENVKVLMCRLEELQDRINQARIIIKQVLVNSKEMSNPIVTSRRLDMSKSNLDRITLLKAIEARNPPPPPPAGAMDLPDEINDQNDNNEDDKAHSEHFETIDENREEIPKLKLTTVFTMGVDIESEHRPFISDNDESPSSNDPTNSSGGSNTNTEADQDLQDLVTSPNNSEPPIEATRVQTASVKPQSSSDESESDGSSSEESATESEPEEKQDRRKRSKDNKGSEEKSGTSNSSKQNKPGSVLKHFIKLKNGSFQCSQCFKILKNRRSLGKHLLIHSPPKFKCTWNNKCGKIYFHKRNLDVHIKSVHEKRKDFKCPIKGCGKRFTQKFHLDVHVRNVHKGVRGFKCPMEECGKKFASKYLRDVHVMGVHEGRRDFVCHVEDCGKAWASWGELNKHICRVHYKSIKKKRVQVPSVSSSESESIPDPQIEVESVEDQIR